MSAAEKRMARERLSWVNPAREGMLRACGDDVIGQTFRVFSTVDSTRFILKIPLRVPVGKDTRGPLRTYLRCWAEQHECEVPVIRITGRYVQAEVLTKVRVWNRDSMGRFKDGPKRFQKKSQ